MSALRTLRGSERAVAALALLVAAVAVTVAAHTRPSFDAYGWLDWGRMTLHGGLNTNAAPSWKPLPWLFTLVFGLFGRGAELWLWMGTVTLISFAGVAWAARLAWGLVMGTGGPAGRAEGGGGGGRGDARGARAAGGSRPVPVRLPALRAELPERSDDRRVRARGGGLPAAGPAGRRVRPARPGIARPARGVAVARGLRGLAGARAARSALGGGGGGGPRRRPVVRGARAQLALVVRRRRQRGGVRVRAARRWRAARDHGARAARLPAAVGDVGGGRGRGRLGGVAALAAGPGARRRRARVDRGRGRLRHPRLAGARALHVRAGRDGDRARRLARGTTARR